MKIIRDEQPNDLHQRLQETLFACRRTSSIGHFFNYSIGKIGKQSIENRLNHMDSLMIVWLGQEWSGLKKTFFN